MSCVAPRALLALRHFFHAYDPAPDRVRAAAYAAGRHAGKWRLAAALELIADSADTPAPLKVRSAHAAPPRVLTFAMPGRILEMDLTPTLPGVQRASGLVIGGAEPGPAAGEVMLRHPDGCVTGGLDECGGFRVEDIPCGPLSVVFRSNGSAPAVGDWFVC